MDTRHQNGQQPLNIALKTLAVTCVMLFAGFGVMAIQYGFSIRNGSDQWINQLLYWLIEYDMSQEPGLSTVEDTLGFYKNALGAMTTHMVVGGLVVSLGMLQFVPALRRKNPMMHRLTGVFMMVGMVAVSVSAIVFLRSISMEQEIAGRSFYIGLWGLAVLSLILLGQSVLALLSKDFRGHMAWMGMTFACFLTAPLLRVNYTLVGSFETMTLNRLVQNSVGSSLAITLALVGVWLIHVGDKDLPFRGDRESLRMPKPVVLIFGGMAAVGYTMGAWLMATGKLEHFNLRTENLSLIVGAWVLAKIWLAHQSVQCWNAGIAGGKPSFQYSLAVLVGVLITWSLLPFIDRSSFQGHALFYGLIHFMAVECLLLVLAHFTPAISTGRNLFTLCSATNTWSAALMPPLMLGAMGQGLLMDEAFYSALGRVVSITMVIGLCAGAVVKPRFFPTKVKPSARGQSLEKQLVVRIGGD